MSSTDSRARASAHRLFSPFTSHATAELLDELTRERLLDRVVIDRAALAGFRCRDLSRPAFFPQTRAAAEGGAR